MKKNQDSNLLEVRDLSLISHKI